MGIYLGANALGGGGSGGGAVSFDPMTLDRRVAQAQYISIQRGTTTSYYSNDDNFWVRYGVPYDYVTIETSNTDYVTLKDVTTAPKGGRLHHVIGPTNATFTATYNFKITVDGTEHIIRVEPDNDSWNQYIRPVLGGSFYALYTTSGTPSQQWAIGNAYDMYFDANSPNSQNGIGGFFNPRATAAGYLKIPTEPYLFNGIYFKETLKVEVQCSNVTTNTTAAWRNAGVAVSIF